MAVSHLAMVSAVLVVAAGADLAVESADGLSINVVSLDANSSLSETSAPAVSASAPSPKSSSSLGSDVKVGVRHGNHPTVHIINHRELTDGDNCTKCVVWHGPVCAVSQTCTFCNTSKDYYEADGCPEGLVCGSDGICQDQGPPGSGPGSSGDALGKVIAIVLLSIFLLSILTLCLRIMATSCSNAAYALASAATAGGERPARCCVVQCAFAIQCCCQWKAGRLRILPAGGASSGADSVDVEDAAAARRAQHRNRGSLCPPPPPAYMELYPDGTVRPQNNNNSAILAEESGGGAASNLVVEVVQEGSAEAIEDPEAAMGAISWIRSDPTSPAASNINIREERLSATGQARAASRSAGWFGLIRVQESRSPSYSTDDPAPELPGVPRGSEDSTSASRRSSWSRRRSGAVTASLEEPNREAAGSVFRSFRMPGSRSTPWTPRSTEKSPEPSMEKSNMTAEDYETELCSSPLATSSSFLTLNVEDLKGTLERLERMQEKSRPASSVYYAPDYADLLSPKSTPWSPVLRRPVRATPAAPEYADLEAQDLQSKSTLEYGDLQIPSPRLLSPIPPISPAPELRDQSGEPDRSPEHQEARAASTAPTPASQNLSCALGRPKTS